MKKEISFRKEKEDTLFGKHFKGREKSVSKQIMLCNFSKILCAIS